jgi:hypothetical protein
MGTPPFAGERSIGGGRYHGGGAGQAGPSCLGAARFQPGARAGGAALDPIAAAARGEARRGSDGVLISPAVMSLQAFEALEARERRFPRDVAAEGIAL